MFAAVVGWQLYGVPRVSAVTPGPDAFVKDASTALVLDVRGLAKLQNVVVTLDGQDVTATAARSGDTLTISTQDLPDGQHSVSFRATSSNVFRHDVSKDWNFTVDTSIPTLHLDAAKDKGRINTDPATFTGKTEALATVTVSAGGLKASGRADAAGEYVVKLELPDGPSTVSVVTTDRAGNATSKQLDVYVDAQPPVLKVTTFDKEIKKSGITVRVSATDQLGVPKLRFVLDGQERDLTGTTSKARFKTSGLAQGRHVLLVTASDKGGNLVKSKQSFTVNSTEHFGSASMQYGARGKDVRVLQTKLTTAGVYSGRTNGFFDADTEKAVRKLQAKFGLEVDGVVGGNVLTALSGQIIVDIGDLRLYLYRDGKLIKSYPVATGQPAYPTPTGTYAVVTMTKDPTWLPPNSDWAKDAQPIPPGTENPLGTRWMGTSAPGVGMHGVPPSEDGTIGTYASHGCIRMHNWDAVDLFDRITIGMPVIIRP